MMKERNGMATAGFVLSLCSIPLFVSGLLCLIGVMLNTLIGLVFGAAAGVTAVSGIVFSAIGNHKSYEEGVCGTGLSLAGLLAGTIVLTLVLAALTLLLVAAYTV